MAKKRKNLRSNIANHKSICKYIIISSVITVLHLMLYFIGGIDKVSFEFALCCHFIFLGLTPILAILFGIYSFVITKRIIVPNLCIFLAYTLFIGVGNYIFRGCFYFIDSMLFAGIVVGISLIASLVTMWEYRSFIKAQRIKDFENIVR